MQSNYKCLSTYEYKIKSRLKSHIKFTDHARRAMYDDSFNTHEILTALQNFKIIEHYENAKPFPSFLLLCCINQKPIHIVCALPEDVDMLIIVTMYIPSDENWSEHTRRKK